MYYFGALLSSVFRTDFLFRWFTALSNRTGLRSHPWNEIAETVPSVRESVFQHPSRARPEGRRAAGLDASCPIDALDLPHPAPPDDFIVRERSRNINRVRVFAYGHPLYY
jgi:hypothetical protein